MLDSIKNCDSKWHDDAVRANLVGIFLDKSKIDEKHCAERYSEHYRFCQKYPTVGMILGEKYIYSGPKFSSDAFNKNLGKVRKNPSVKAERDAFHTLYKKLYPKTGEMRKVLIDGDCFELEYVKPIKRGVIRAIRHYLKRCFK